VLTQEHAPKEEHHRVITAYGVGKQNQRKRKLRS